MTLNRHKKRLTEAQELIRNEIEAVYREALECEEDPQHQAFLNGIVVGLCNASQAITWGWIHPPGRIPPPPSGVMRENVQPEVTKDA